MKYGLLPYCFAVIALFKYDGDQCTLGRNAKKSSSWLDNRPCIKFRMPKETSDKQRLAVNGQTNKTVLKYDEISVIWVVTQVSTFIDLEMTLLQTLLLHFSFVEKNRHFALNLFDRFFFVCVSKWIQLESSATTYFEEHWKFFLYTEFNTIVGIKDLSKFLEKVDELHRKPP